MLFFTNCLCIAADAVKQAASATSREEKLKESKTLLTQAQRLRNEGKLDEAIAAAERAIAIEREILAPEQQGDLAASLDSLAGLQESKGDFAAAHKVRQEVLAIQVRLHGPTHWQTIDARLSLEKLDILAKLSVNERRELERADKLNSQVVSLYGTGKYREAIPLAVDSLAIQKRLLGENHCDYATSLYNLAALYQAQGDYARAEPLYRQALEIEKRVLGENHPDYAASLNDLAEICHEQGDLAWAQKERGVWTAC